MYTHLNPRTRLIVGQLTSGGSPKIGGETVPALTESQRLLLHVLAMKSSSLARGSDLVKQIEKELSGDSALPSGADASENAAVETDIVWRFGKVRAHSFRGLAPAG